MKKVLLPVGMVILLLGTGAGLWYGFQRMNQPQTAQPQTAQPQTAQPQTAQPQTAQPQTAQPQVRFKVAVLGANDFVPDRVVASSQGLPDDLAARVMEHLVKSGRFEVLERSVLRRVILEQRFGQSPEKTFLDRMLDAAIDDLSHVSGYTAERVGALADYRDLVKDYQDLGTAIEADYLIFAVLEKAREGQRAVVLPYSERALIQNVRDARVRLRVIEVESGKIVGAESFRSREAVFATSRRERERDAYSLYDELGLLVARKVLDVISPAQVVHADPPVINRGRNDGYQVGEVLILVRPGQEISDPNGVVLERLTTPVGKARIATVQEKIATLHILEGEVRPGDWVRPQRQVTGGKVGAVPAAPRPLERSAPKGRLVLAVAGLRLADRAALSPEEGARMRDLLLVRLSQNQRFALLERQEMDQLLDEKLFQSITQGRDLAGYLQQLAGADYLVLGSIDRFDVVTRRHRVPYVDRVEYEHRGVAEATLRIVDVRNGQVMAAEKISLDLPLRQRGESYDRRGAYDRLFHELSERMTAKIVARLYPIKVLAVAPSGEVFINRGEDGGIQAGQRFQVLRPGEEMIDPDTGLSFGHVESRIAILEIIQVEPNRAKGILVAGEGVQNGDIVRSEGKKATARRNKAPSVKRPNF